MLAQRWPSRTKQADIGAETPFPILSPYQMILFCFHGANKKRKESNKETTAVKAHQQHQTSIKHSGKYILQTLPHNSSTYGSIPWCNRCLCFYNVLFDGTSHIKQNYCNTVVQCCVRALFRRNTVCGAKPCVALVCLICHKQGGVGWGGGRNTKCKIYI